MKKTSILFFLIFIIFAFILYTIKYIEVDLMINWNIYFPPVSNDKIIFSDFFQDGDGIRVISFNNKRKTEKILKKYKFTKISSDNMNYIRSKVDKFYNSLNDDGKNAFTKNIDINTIINDDSGNYYLYREKRQGKTYIILLYDNKNDNIYTLESVRN